MGQSTTCGPLLSPQAVEAVAPRCYLADFRLSNFPWKQAECLNIEEVFKNYAYFDAKWSKENRKLEVVPYRAGTALPAEQYEVVDDRLCQRVLSDR